MAQAIFHRLVLEYLQSIYAFLPAEEADKKMHELLDVCIESLADIVHTKDGSAVAREILARGVAKDRKNILRVLKPHLEKLCQDAEAQMVLFTAFDVVDDTKMMAKAILTASLDDRFLALPCVTATLTGSILKLAGNRRPRTRPGDAQDRPSSLALPRHPSVIPTLYPFDDQGSRSDRCHRGVDE